MEQTQNDMGCEICDTMSIRKSNFSAFLVTSNGIDKSGFYQWVFYPGMLFQSASKWWGDWGTRKRPHEGLDICFYRGTDGIVSSLDAKVNIPVLYEGTVVWLFVEFLGKSVFVLIYIYDTHKNQLCRIFGHTDPCHYIEPATPLGEGAIIATICDAERRGAQMSSHLLLSIAWVPKSYDYQQLNWETLHQNTEVMLADPLDFIECNYTILPNR